MELGSLVYAYYWHHHSVEDGNHLAKEDDRKGWFLRLCNGKALLLRQLEARKTDDGIPVSIVFDEALGCEIEVRTDLISKEGIGVGDLCRLKAAPSRLFEVIGVIHETLTWHETAKLSDTKTGETAYWYTKQLIKELNPVCDRV